MVEHPIQHLMNTAMGNLKEMISANTIIGDPISASDGSVILPVSKVSFGFGAGGTEFMTENTGSKFPFGGGSGSGASISPVAFLVITNEEISVIHLADKAHLLDKVMDATPGIVQKIQEAWNKNKGSNVEVTYEDVQ